MPRKARAQEDEAYHHVYARGNRRWAIFIDDEDRRWFMARLLQAEVDSGSLHVAHCLMPNHFHLLVRPGPSGISTLLHRVLGPYAQWFNRRHECVGHLFQGRFGSRVIDSDEDFLTVLRYIHRNPVEAGLVPRPELWEWSSHLDHLRTRPPVRLREGVQLARSRLSEDPERAVVLYRRLVENPEGELLIPLRDEGTPLAMAEMSEGAPDRPTLEEISRGVEAGFALGACSLRSAARIRPLPEARRAFCLAAVRGHRYTLAEVADFLDRSLSNVSVILRHADNGTTRFAGEHRIRREGLAGVTRGTGGTLERASGR